MSEQKLIIDNIKFNTNITEDQLAKLKKVPQVIVKDLLKDEDKNVSFLVETIVGDLQVEIKDKKIKDLFTKAYTDEGTVNLMQDISTKAKSSTSRERGCSRVDSSWKL